jgi:hypothetical protein
LLSVSAMDSDTPPATLLPANASASGLFNNADDLQAFASPTHEAHSPATEDHTVVVTATEVITHHDKIPRFGANPTIRAVTNGTWSDPRIWSLGRVPINGDKVTIDEGVSITYGIASNVRLSTLEISGTLAFASAVNTRLIVGDIMVMPGGTLQIGTEAAPIAPSVTAELVIADKPLAIGMLTSPGTDPSQYGTGLIAFGTVTMHGAVKDITWTRLGTEPRAGDSQLILSSAATTWRPGEILILPDTRQVSVSTNSAVSNAQWEEVEIDRVEGNRVFLKAPLKFDHRGARDVAGNLQLLPHVGVLNRNVIIRSENAAGTRGHVFLGGRAEIDINYARFKDLGRTDAFQNLDSTTFDEHSNLTHIGTNQVGRYAVHIHHLLGPENPTNTGYQFQFIGNTIDGFRKWGVALHDTSFGLLQDNIAYDGQGAAFVTEDGSEVGNDLIHNFAMRLRGTMRDGGAGTATGDYARGGVGFWHRRAGNNSRDNVAADCSYAGFVFTSYNLWTVTLPVARGVDKNEPGQGHEITTSPVGLFENHEAYGLSANGLWAAYFAGPNTKGPESPVLLNNLSIWHVVNAGIVMYHTANVTFDGLTIFGDFAADKRNDTGATGMWLNSYENFDTVIKNSKIEGMRYGIFAPQNDSSDAYGEKPTVVRDSIFRNYYNIFVRPSMESRPSMGNSLEVRNVIFGHPLGPLPAGPASPDTLAPAANIIMHYETRDINLTHRSTVRVYDYNGVPSDDFQVFYKEQSSTFVMPQTSANALGGRDSHLIGSPANGLTNQQNWDKYRIATAGAVAPSHSTTHSGIIGLTAPIQLIASIPRVVLVTPWQGAHVANNAPTRIRYNVIGNLPTNSKIYFDIDGKWQFSEYNDGGIWGLPEGVHTLTAYIGDAITKAQIPGTSKVSVQFAVSLNGARYPISTTVVPPNSSPYDIILSANKVTERAFARTVIGNLTTLDPDANDSHTYSLVDNAGGRFSLEGNRLVVANGSALRFATAQQHTIRVRTTDREGLTFEKTFTIAVTRVSLNISRVASDAETLLRSEPIWHVISL